MSSCISVARRVSWLILGYEISQPMRNDHNNSKHCRILAGKPDYIKSVVNVQVQLCREMNSWQAYGVFKAVPTNPPTEPEMKLFISCPCGVCPNVNDGIHT